jgi:hypothetical protein
MNLAKISLAAALAVSALGLAGTASAQDRHHGGGGNNGHHGGGWNNGHHNGWRGGGHEGWGHRRGGRSCWVVWRHHHRDRVCGWR